MKRKKHKIHTMPNGRARMPIRLSGDPHVVTWLLDESERLAALGNRWATAKTPNHLAADACLRSAWAHAISGAWLRCKLKGEFDGPRPSESAHQKQKYTKK